MINGPVTAALEAEPTIEDTSAAEAPGRLLREHPGKAWAIEKARKGAEEEPAQRELGFEQQGGEANGGDE